MPDLFCALRASSHNQLVTLSLLHMLLHAHSTLASVRRTCTHLFSNTHKTSASQHLRYQSDGVAPISPNSSYKAMLNVSVAWQHRAGVQQNLQLRHSQPSTASWQTVNQPDTHAARHLTDSVGSVNSRTGDGVGTCATCRAHRAKNSHSYYYTYSCCLSRQHTPQPPTNHPA